MDAFEKYKDVSMKQASLFIYFFISTQIELYCQQHTLANVSGCIKWWSTALTSQRFLVAVYQVGEVQGRSEEIQSCEQKGPWSFHQLLRPERETHRQKCRAQWRREGEISVSQFVWVCQPFSNVVPYHADDCLFKCLFSEWFLYDTSNP